MKLKFKRLTPTAIAPCKNKPNDAGFDLSADLGLGQELSIAPMKWMLIPTNIAVAVEPGYYLRVAPRSGLALKSGIDTLAGVVDSGYRDGIGVILMNFGKVPFTVRHGDRIAQGILEKIAECEEVEEVDELPSSERGTLGYGSSGV